MKKQIDGGERGKENNGRTVSSPRVNKKFESVRMFLANYFAPENGRCEKLPNPRYGRDEYRLPIWLSKAQVYRVYTDDCEKCKGKFRFVPSLIFDSHEPGTAVRMLNMRVLD